MWAACPVPNRRTGTSWRKARERVASHSPISITYQFSSAAALLLARLSLSLVTSRRPLLLLLMRHSWSSTSLLLLRLRLLPLALMVLHWPLIKVLGVLDMTTPPPSSSATVSRHHMITRSRDGKPKVFSATHYPLSCSSIRCFFDLLLSGFEGTRMARIHAGWVHYFGHYCSSPLCRWHTHYWKRCSCARLLILCRDALRWRSPMAKIPSSL